MSLPPRKKREKMGIREERRSYPGHLRWLRGFVCAVWSAGECEGRTEAHHLRENGAGGTGIKPPDWMAVPLCSHHHAAGHAVGWKTFEAKYKVDLSAVAEKMAKLSPHRSEWME